MARGRMINQSISEDIEFNDMSCEAKMLFMMAIPHLDRDGLISGHIAILQGKVCPLMPDLLARMQDIFNEWEDAGLVISYSSKRGPVLFFTGFSKNNSGMHYSREGASVFPPPPGYKRGEKGLEPEENSTPTNTNHDGGGNPDLLRTNSGLTQDEVPLKGSLKEIEKNYNTTAREDEPQTVQNGSGGSVFPEAQPEAPKSQSPVPKPDPDYAQACRSFEENGFGLLSPLLADEIADLLKDYPLSWITSAMRTAVGANKRQLRYVNGILRKWRADGVDPIAQTDSKPPPGNSPIRVQVDDNAAAVIAQLWTGGQHATSQRHH